jgi:hypothetical protein
MASGYNQTQAGVAKQLKIRQTGEELWKTKIEKIVCVSVDWKNWLSSCLTG